MNSLSLALVQPISRANAACDLPAGRRNSSSSISPGWIGFAGCSARFFVMPVQFLASVIVHYRDIHRLPMRPPEYDPPLVVDPDGVESPPAPLQCFQAIARRHPEVCQLGRVVQIKNLAAR